MSKIRLLPVLVFGLMSLLGIKLLGISFDTAPGKPNAGLQVAPGERFAKAIERAREGAIDDEILTGSTGAMPNEIKKPDPAKPVADKDAGMPKAVDGAVPTDSQRAKVRSEPEGVRLPPPPATQAEGQRSASPTEREILEKLKTRRAAIDAQDRDLEMRDALLRATERKLDEKIGLLRSLESQEGQGAPKNDVKARYKPLVTMYESMKPKEAARVFDKLDIAILLDLVGHMNPRKMSEILAVMEPVAASKLTVALARLAAQGPPQTADAAPANDAELPRLPVQAPRR